MPDHTPEITTLYLTLRGLNGDPLPNVHKFVLIHDDSMETSESCLTFEDADYSIHIFPLDVVHHVRIERTGGGVI